MLSKIINILNTCIPKSGVSWAELLPGDFLDTLEQAEKINIRSLRQQLSLFAALNFTVKQGEMLRK